MSKADHIVVASTGAWYKLSPDNVIVALQKQGAGVVGPETISVAMENGHVTSSVPGVTVAIEIIKAH